MASKYLPARQPCLNIFPSKQTWTFSQCLTAAFDATDLLWPFALRSFLLPMRRICSYSSHPISENGRIHDDGNGAPAPAAVETMKVVGDSSAFRQFIPPRCPKLYESLIPHCPRHGRRRINLSCMFLDSRSISAFKNVFFSSTQRLHSSWLPLLNSVMHACLQFKVFHTSCAAGPFALKFSSYTHIQRFRLSASEPNDENQTLHGAASGVDDTGPQFGCMNCCSASIQDTNPRVPTSRALVLAQMSTVSMATMTITSPFINNERAK